MSIGPLPLAATLAAIYVLGVGVGLVTTDARGLARVGLALAWPIGPLAFLVTVSMLLLASAIAFPIVGAIAVAAAVSLFLLL